VARLLAGVVGHNSSITSAPNTSNRLAVLRNQVFVLDHMYMSLFSTCGWILRLGITLALLVSIHPVLGAIGCVCTADGADVDLAARSGAGRRRARRRRQSPGAAPLRPGDHGGAGQGGAGDPASGLVSWPSAAKPGSAGTGPSPPPELRSALWHSLGWAIFGAGYVNRGGICVVGAEGTARRCAAQCWPRARAYRPTSVRRLGEIGFLLRGVWLDGSIRLGVAGRLLRQVNGQSRCTPCPEKLESGIRFEHMSFAYPGTDRLVLDQNQSASRARLGGRDRG